MEQIHEFYIKGAYFNKTKCFPALNDLLRMATSSPYKYGKAKKEYGLIASRFIRKGLGKWTATKRVIPHYTFYEPLDGHYRDLDNISAAARKIINDELVSCGIIKDDKPKYLEFGTSEFRYTKDIVGIHVVLEEVED